MRYYPAFLEMRINLICHMDSIYVYALLCTIWICLWLQLTICPSWLSKAQLPTLCAVRSHNIMQSIFYILPLVYKLSLAVIVLETGNLIG